MTKHLPRHLYFHKKCLAKMAIYFRTFPGTFNIFMKSAWQKIYLAFTWHLPPATHRLPPTCDPTYALPPATHHMPPATCHNFLPATCHAAAYSESLMLGVTASASAYIIYILVQMLKSHIYWRINPQQSMGCGLLLGHSGYKSSCRT